MKLMTTLSIICVLGYGFCNAQTKKTTQIDTTKQINLLDEQAELFGSIFGTSEMDGENPLSGVTNYLELIDKMEASPAEKQYLRDQYKLYDLGLDPKKSEEFKIMFNKKLKEAMNKGMVEEE